MADTVLTFPGGQHVLAGGYIVVLAYYTGADPVPGDIHVSTRRTGSTSWNPQASWDLTVDPKIDGVLFSLPVGDKEGASDLRIEWSWKKPARMSVGTDRGQFYVDPDQPEPCSLLIEDVASGRAIDRPTWTQIVGRKVNLGVKAKAPQGFSIQSQQWSVSGQKVKSYNRSVHKGVYTDLAPVDMTSNPISFYWINGGQNSITVNAVLTNGQETIRCSKTVYVSVLRPIVINFDAKPPNQRGQTTVDAFLECGDDGKGAGMKWESRVRAPVDGAGQIAHTQLCSPDSRWTTNTGDNLQTTTPGKAFWLDRAETESGEAAPELAGEYEHIKSGEEKYWGSVEDAPKISTGELIELSADSKFQLYLSYRPEGDDSIWVSLKTFEWKWCAHAKLNALRRWELVGPNKQATAKSSVETFQLPTWDGWVQAITPAAGPAPRSCPDSDE
jgi:hypothetical protein